MQSGALGAPGERDLAVHQELEIDVAGLGPGKDRALQIWGEEREPQHAPIIPGGGRSA